MDNRNTYLLNLTLFSFCSRFNYQLLCRLQHLVIKKFLKPIMMYIPTYVGKLLQTINTLLFSDRKFILLMMCKKLSISPIFLI
jgi:hypothetical protein